MKHLTAAILTLGSLTAIMIPTFIYEKYCDGNLPSDLTFATMSDNEYQVQAALKAQKKFCGYRV